MKKFLSLGLLLAVCSAPVYAQQSAKNAVQISSLNLISADPVPGDFPGVGDTGATPILDTQLRTSQQKDLVIGVSLECGLFTRTLVRSRGGNKDESTADATVQVRVVVDAGMPWARVAYPGSGVAGPTGAEDGWVTFCRRDQLLAATLQGIFDETSDFTDCFPDGVFDPTNTGCDLLYEEIELVLTTLNANAFFYALDDLGAGLHTVEVQARIDVDTTNTNGESNAEALVGQGSLTVEEVRLVKGDDIIEN